MHSLNCLLFVMVATGRLDLISVRRNRQLSGPKTQVSRCVEYHRTYGRERRERNKRAGLCVECSRKARSNQTRCGECARVAKIKRNL